MSLPVYIIAIQSVLGWLLFLVFAGVGLFAAPIDWLQVCGSAREGSASWLEDLFGLRA